MSLPNAQNVILATACIHNIAKDFNVSMPVHNIDEHFNCLPPVVAGSNVIDNNVAGNIARNRIVLDYFTR